MITLAVGDVLEAAIVCSQGNQLGIMVRHYRVGAIFGTSATDQDFASDLATRVSPEVRALLSSSASFLGVRVTKLFPLPRSLSVTSSNGAGLGLVTGEPLPKQVAGVITLRTNFAGRGFRGRAYVPFAGEDSNGPTSQPVPAYIANLALLAIELLASVGTGIGANTATLDPVLWKRKTASTVPLTSSRSNTRWGTQRRRGDYGQPNVITL
jgi:hypothetical protein